MPPKSSGGLEAIVAQPAMEGLERELGIPCSDVQLVDWSETGAFAPSSPRSAGSSSR